MENFFAIGLRATFGPCSEAELAFGKSVRGTRDFHTMERMFPHGGKPILFLVLGAKGLVHSRPDSVKP